MDSMKSRIGIYQARLLLLQYDYPSFYSTPFWSAQPSLVILEQEHFAASYSGSKEPGFESHFYFIYILLLP